MNKVLVAVTSISGIAAVVTPATFLMMNGGDEAEKIWGSSGYARTVQTKYGDIGCVKDQFRELKWKQGEVENKLPDVVDKFSSNLKGCLVGKYVKQTFPDSKWSGNFKLVWTVSDEKQGLMTVINVSTKDKKWDGGVTTYFLQSLNGNTDKWIVKNIKEKKEETISNLKSWLPESINSMKFFPKNGEDWSTGDDLTKACSYSNCGQATSLKVPFFSSWKISKNGYADSGISVFYQKLRGWVEKHIQWNNWDTLLNDLNINWESKDWEE